MAYLLLALPAALMIRRIGYQRGISWVGHPATGAFLFIRGLVFKTFGAFLFALFVLATGLLCCIETAANPYVTILGAERRPPDVCPLRRRSTLRLTSWRAHRGGALLFGQKWMPIQIFNPPPAFTLSWVASFSRSSASSLIKLPVIEANTIKAEGRHGRSDLHRLARPATAFHHGYFHPIPVYIISQIGIGAFAVNYILENAITDAPARPPLRRSLIGMAN